MTRSFVGNSGATAPPSHCNSWRSWRLRLRRRTTPTCSREKISRSRSISLRLEYRCGSKTGERSGGKRSA